MASVILLLQLALSAWCRREPVLQADSTAWFWLGLSGFIGVVIGDTCYFRSLQIPGPRKALIVSTTAPIFAAVFGALFLGESLTVTITAGILIATAGVVYVVAERHTTNESAGLFPGSTGLGVMTGTLGAVCQAGGAVCSKLGMEPVIPWKPP